MMKKVKMDAETATVKFQHTTTFDDEGAPLFSGDTTTGTVVELQARFSLLCAELKGKRWAWRSWTLDTGTSRGGKLISGAGDMRDILEADWLN